MLGISEQRLFQHHSGLAGLAVAAQRLRIFDRVLGVLGIRAVAFAPGFRCAPIGLALRCRGSAERTGDLRFLHGFAAGRCRRERERQQRAWRGEMQALRNAQNSHGLLVGPDARSPWIHLSSRSGLNSSKNTLRPD